MRKSTITLVAAAVVAGVCAGGASSAHALSKRVRNACGLDYQDFCAQYHPGSSAVRRCFESNRRSLSKGCIRALVDAGEVPRKYLRR